MSNENLDFEDLLVRLGQLIADKNRCGESLANQNTQDEVLKRRCLGSDSPVSPARGLSVEPL